jgi:Tol biopolymer transport system component
MKTFRNLIFSILLICASCSKESNPVNENNLENEFIKISEPQLIIKDGSHPEWSPDGTQIAYTGWSDETRQDIYIASKDGSAIQQITFEESIDNHPFWAPDGRSLGFSSNRINDQNYYIFIISIADKEIKQVSPDTVGVQAGDWSPDGHSIVYDGLFSDTNIRDNFLGLTDLTKNETEFFLVDVTYEGWPQFSPKGAQVVFESLVSHDYNIWTANIDGTNLTQITTDGGEYPTWSPDGEWILYSNIQSGNYDLFIIKSDGSQEAIKVIDTKDANEVRSSWSPDGQSIIYDTMLGTEKVDPENAGIYVVDIDFLK